MKTYDDVEHLLATGGGVIVGREHPNLRHALQYLLKRKVLVAVCPGVYVRAESKDDIEVRLRAVARWHPDAVFLGEAAARLTFLPQTKVSTIVLATRTKRRAPAGVKLVRWEVPDEHVVEVGGARVSSPAMTALDLCTRDQGHAMGEVLRQGLATLQQMDEVLRTTRYRLANPIRRRFLHDARDEPWSPAEREAHLVLRDGGPQGWVSNFAVNLSGTRFLIDLAYEEFKVGIEVDGYTFHGLHGSGSETRVAFERDRLKQAELVASGWAVLRFTWHQLTESPDWVRRMVRTTLEDRGWTPPRPRRRRTRGATR
ncbi:hypothetical protein ACQBAU_16790 [Propionibacteriaceae bacterium Y2011]|uniref:hypothetical protein n=1 Tax=Microlunatus sp. Y2014 TaxID=3418488 RepID=UPI003B4F9E0D